MRTLPCLEKFQENNLWPMFVLLYEVLHISTPIYAEWIFIKICTDFIPLKIPQNFQFLTSYTAVCRLDTRTYLGGGNDFRRFTKCGKITKSNYGNSGKPVLFRYITGTVETIETILVVKLWTKSIAIIDCKAFELHVHSNANCAPPSCGIASRKLYAKFCKDYNSKILLYY